MKKLSVCLVIMMLIGLLSGVSFAEEKRVLRIGAVTDYTDNFEKWDAIQRIKDELNIDIEFTYYITDAYNAMLAGDALPDLMMGKNNLPTVIANKVAMNVRPYLEEYCPNALGDAYKPTVDLLCNLLGGEDNGMYIFSPLVGMGRPYGGNTMVQRGYVLRYDYYKELGCPPINNDDEYIDVLLKMHELHPTADDGSTAYLMGTETGLGDLGGYRASWLMDYAQNVWCINLYRSSNWDNELIDGYTDLERSVYWADMKFFNKVYRAGGGEGGFGYDPDCFTMTTDEFKAKVAIGQYIGMEYLYTNLYNEAKKEDPDTIKAHFVVPSANTVTYAWYAMPLGNAPTSFWFIPKDSKNWDLALRYLNYLCDPEYARYCYSGEKDVHWYYDEAGVPHLTDESVEGIKNVDEYWSSSGKGHGDEQNVWMLRGSTICADGYPANLTLVPEMFAKTQTKLMDDISKTYDVDYYFQAYEKVGARDYRNDLGENISAALSEIPNEIQRIRTAINDIMKAAMPELVMAESDEEWNAIQAEVLAELEEVGEPIAWEWFKTNWEGPKNAFNAILSDVQAAYGLEPWPIPEK